MIESNEKRVSLKVVSPQGPSQQGRAPPTAVLMSEPMRRFACNQKGCCCSGWDIPFRLEDLMRLNEHLPDAERAVLTKDIKLVVDANERGENGETILHSVKLDGVGPDRACRFLEPQGICRVHATAGLEALPDLCVDFPAASFHRDDGAVELWWDPVCPEVLEQIDEGDTALTLHKQDGLFGDAMLDLRVSHATDTILGRIGKRRVDSASLDGLRKISIGELARTDRPAWHTLAVLLDGYARLAPDEDGKCVLLLNHGVEPGPFLRFFWACIGAHGPDLLMASFVKYRRFIHAIDPQPLVSRRQILEEHLTRWEPAFETFLAPQDDLLAPLAARYLSHRFATPMVKGRAELRAAADEIVHLYATAQRYAAAMGATLGKPVDRKLFLVALGAAEFFFRSLRLPRESLPWFASRDTGDSW
jgi:Fe-S-cluster containining protein